MPRDRNHETPRGSPINRAPNSCQRNLDFVLCRVYRRGSDRQVMKPRAEVAHSGVHQGCRHHSRGLKVHVTYVVCWVRSERTNAWE
ncbi:hypothetical protein L596_002980 [Steinernema carpocapsae]|uniref:Uncharacterized protein n=1 Tax=Steinernema carpocapsae TaxID=34508 RepID=A0A4U8UTX7_STECR|nr:hypothetical protein L596_002980 [Steinernema carpocapsae]